MSFGVLLALALAMAMDTFAVAIGVSLVMKGCTPRQTFRLAGSFGSFQFLMPLLGWTVGRTVVDLVRGFDHWLAAGLLAVVAGKMIVEALEKKKDGKAAGPCPDKTRGGHLLLLSLATSIDALAVGLSLAALNVSVVYPAAVIGLVTFVSAVGTKIGPVLGRWAGKSAELAGALVLLAIAAKILVEHLS